MYLLIVSATALVCMLWGWRAGLFRMLLRLLALCLAYGLAIRGTPSVADFLVQREWLNGLLALPVVGVALLLLGSLLFGAAAKPIAAAAPEEWRRGGKNGRHRGRRVGLWRGPAVGLGCWHAARRLAVANGAAVCEHCSAGAVAGCIAYGCRTAPRRGRFDGWQYGSCTGRQCSGTDCSAMGA
ncbi:MAG: hypothetical protein R3E61_05285 [Pseudomonadales bacterium]